MAKDKTTTNSRSIDPINHRTVPDQTKQMADPTRTTNGRSIYPTTK
jgi:hypothetical protein